MNVYQEEGLQAILALRWSPEYLTSSLFLVQRQLVSLSLHMAGSVCAQRATKETVEYAMEMLQM